MAKNKTQDSGELASVPVTAPTTPPAAAAGDSKKPSVAEHDWINAAGDVVDDLELATGIKYRDKSTGEYFTYQIPLAEPGKVQTMFAVWGARTKAINTGSAARQKRKSDADFNASDVAHMTATFAGIVDGTWEAAGERKRGPAYDLDVLADAIVFVLTNAGATPNHDKIRAKLGDDVSYRSGAMKMPEVLQEYNARKGSVKSISSLNVE